MQTQTRILSEDDRREHPVESFAVNARTGKGGSREGPAANGHGHVVWAYEAHFSEAHGHHGRDATPGLRGEDGGIIDVSVSVTLEKLGK